MSPELFARLRSLYHEAAGLDGPARAALLQRVEAHDSAALRHALERLLQSSDGAAFLEQPALLSPAFAGLRGGAAPADAPFDTVPERIGRYRLLRRVGSGGMGVVFEAEQEKPRRRVALKLIRPGAASAAVLRRFETEARVLGRLQHPGIAQVFEAGAETIGAPGGLTAVLPYLALEFVSGRPLLEHAAVARLDVAPRLELLAAVCDAVQHAHQKGVLHRDLKPANILVDDSGRPRVLDFGVARLLDDDDRSVTLETAAGQLVGTLPYMSPEQVAGDPRGLDTRTDVYALGVIGYQLLSGRLPLDLSGRALPDALRSIREDEPSPLGVLERRYRGDIETIIGKALARDREQRYASAAELAADLRRCLRHEPISARPAGTLYHLGRFARRNRALTATAAAAAALLTGAAAFSTWQMLRAREAEQRSVAAFRRAQTEAARAAAINDFLTRMLTHVDPAAAQGYDTALLRRLLDEAAGALDVEFADQPDVRADLQHTVGRVYLALNELQPAAVHAAAATAWRAAQLGPQAPATLASRALLAAVRVAQGRYAEAEELYRDVWVARTAALGDVHAETLTARYGLAGVLWRLDRIEEATRELTAALGAMQTHLGLGHDVTLEAQNGLALLRMERGEHAAALDLLERVRDTWTRTKGPQHPATLVVERNLGNCLERLGRYPEAATHQRRLLEASRAVFGEDHAQSLEAAINLGSLLMTLRSLDESETLLRATRDRCLRRFGADHPLTLKAAGNLCITLRRLDRLDEAAACFSATLESAERVHGPDHASVRRLLSNYAGLLYNLQRLDAAAGVMRRVIDADRRRHGDGHIDVLTGEHNLGLVMIEQQEFAAAVELLQGVVTRSDAVAPPGHPLPYEFRRSLGDALRGVRRFDEAEALLLAAFDGLQAAHGDGHARTRAVRTALHQLYVDWERADQAAAWRVE